MADELMIQAEGLTKSYGETQALAGVSFGVPAGTILGLLGPERRRQDDGRADPDHAGRARRRRRRRWPGSTSFGTPARCGATSAWPPRTRRWTRC